MAERRRRLRHLRTRARRSARVWALSTRRAAHLAAIKVRGARRDAESRARLEEQFAIRTAEDVARELGQLKGVLMKLGQMVSFIVDGLPPEAQQVLATLQSDVPPMAPSLAARVIRDELGAEPDEVFLRWDPVPVAAASVGQVHRAVLHDGRDVAVKVQYPGAGSAIHADLDNAELLYAMAARFSFAGLDTRALVDELRARMGDELDYRKEAANQAELHARYRGHPFIRVPAVIGAMSTGRVLTSEWVDGQRWDEFLASADDTRRQHAAEVLFRFAQGGIHRHGVFNGDPHPGNYRFHADGSVTFLDYGLVKRWTPGEWEALSPCLDAVLTGDADATTAAMVAAGFLAPDHGLDPAAVFAYVSAPYVPYLTERFRFTRGFVSEALGSMLDVKGPNGAVIRALDMPPSFLILNRVVWGVSALLGRLEAEGPWRGILLEYRRGAPPATELGRAEAAWRAEGARRS